MLYAHNKAPEIRLNLGCSMFSMSEISMFKITEKNYKLQQTRIISKHWLRLGSLSVGFSETSLGAFSTVDCEFCSTWGTSRTGGDSCSELLASVEAGSGQFIFSSTVHLKNLETIRNAAIKPSPLSSSSSKSGKMSLIS